MVAEIYRHDAALKRAAAIRILAGMPRPIGSHFRHQLLFAFSPEVRERAVRMLLNHWAEQSSQWDTSDLVPQ
jgi:hypothetical protein